VSQADLPPAVIAIGETQERLCWIVPPSFTPLLLPSITKSFRCRAFRARAARSSQGGAGIALRGADRGEIVMDIDLDS